MSAEGMVVESVKVAFKAILVLARKHSWCSVCSNTIKVHNLLWVFHGRPLCYECGKGLGLEVS